MCLPVVGEVDKLLWGAKAKLLHVLEKISGLMTKIDMGMKLVMDMGSGLSISRTLNSRQTIVHGPKDTASLGNRLGPKNGADSIMRSTSLQWGVKPLPGLL